MTTGKTTREDLLRLLEKEGCPASFSTAIADMLGTEKTMRRMLGYLRQVKKPSLEDIADEALAICQQRDAWVRRKKAEYYNRRINEMMNAGLGEEDDHE